MENGLEFAECVFTSSQLGPVLVVLVEIDDTVYIYVECCGAPTES